MIESHREETSGYFKLDFKLSPQQELASQKVSEAILSHSPLLLHAVTGAGKTEMILKVFLKQDVKVITWLLSLQE